MRLRVKFILIRVFLLSLPVIVALLVFLMQRVITGTGMGDRFWNRSVQTLIEEVVRAGSFDGIGDRIPPSLVFVAVDASGHVVEATDPGFGPGEAFEPSKLAGPPSGGRGAGYQYSIVSVVLGTDPYTIFARLPAVFGIPHAVRFIWILFFPIGAVLATSIISALMLSKTLRSLNTLKEASLRIASGDLDHSSRVSRRDEIGELAESFDIMRLALKEERARRSMLLMAVTHDLRTPLTSIRGYLDAFADGLAEDKDSRDRYLRILRDKTDLLEARIGELVDYVRMETGEWKLKLQPLEIGAFTRELGAGFAEDARIADRPFELSLKLPDGLFVPADSGLLCRVIENLLHNAFRYTSAGDCVVFSSHRSDDRAIIEVKDSGRGIPADERERIFQPFYRGTRSRNEPGFGLGLSIVKSIVEAHGWTIRLAAEEADTVFRIEIPLETQPV